MRKYVFTSFVGFKQVCKLKRIFKSLEISHIDNECFILSSWRINTKAFGSDCVDIGLCFCEKVTRLNWERYQNYQQVIVGNQL